MPYATLDDLRTAFGDREIDELLDRDGDGQADTGLADRVLDDASHVIDSYLSRRYAVPVTDGAEALRSVACDLARFALYDNAAPEGVLERRRIAVAWLKRLASGEANLPGANGAVAPDADQGDAGVLIKQGRKPIDFTGYT